MSHRAEENDPRHPSSVEFLDGRQHEPESDRQTEHDRQGSRHSTGDDETSPIKNTNDQLGERIVNDSKIRLAKRREELRRVSLSNKGDLGGEQLSTVLTERVEMVPLHLIKDDPKFTNLRLFLSEESLQSLLESMKQDGIKVPITVISANEKSSHYYVRAGFRRTIVARKLLWQSIPAIILPFDTPQVEEYWTNIIENSARAQLHTYEIANAAMIMRDRFHVNPRDFAVRAGYSEPYVMSLLRCLDKLPPEVIEAWKNREKIPIKNLIDWSALQPSEAHKMMLTYAGRNPAIVKGWTPPPRKPTKKPIQMATTKGLNRMQRLRIAIEKASALDRKTRDLCLLLVDYCTGVRNDVPHVYNPLSRAKNLEQKREDLILPSPGELPPNPPDFHE